jgi:hypothetical protein
LEQRLKSLIGEARADATKAKVALAEARQQIDAAMSRALEIAAYWSQDSAIVWRERWKVFATGNGLPTEPFSENIIAAEQKVVGFLNAGDFMHATTGMVGVESE